MGKLEKIQEAIINEVFGGRAENFPKIHKVGIFDAEFWSEEKWIELHSSHKAGGFYMVYDGGMVCGAMNNEFGFTLSEKLDTVLAELGYWREDFSSWATHIMPDN